VSEDVADALRRVRDGADFADALITEFGIDAGCERTVTFDHGAAKSAGMRLLDLPAPSRRS
jgi:predicted nucleic-acid-binding protein